MQRHGQARFVDILHNGQGCKRRAKCYKKRSPVLQQHDVHSNSLQTNSLHVRHLSHYARYESHMTNVALSRSSS